MDLVNLFGASGYALTAFLFLSLALVLLTRWRGRLYAGWLVLVALANAAWAGVLAAQVAWQGVAVNWIWALETLRDLSWILFLLRLLEVRFRERPAVAGRLRLLRKAAVALAPVMMVPLEDMATRVPLMVSVDWVTVRLVLEVLFPLVGLVFAEQVYRNSPAEHGGAVKFLCLGVGALFAYDFFLFSDAFVFDRLDSDLWLARGAANAFVVPLIALSVARSPEWTFDLTVSRKVAFHTTSLVAAGIYLLIMALAGYYIGVHGGKWGSVIQVVFFFIAGLILTALLFSGHFRARVKVFVNKHFFSYKYDYREEWLHLIGVLSGQVLEVSLPERIIIALSELVESPGGAIWLCAAEGHCQYERSWNFAEESLDKEDGFEQFSAFLRNRHWIVNLDEYKSDRKAPGAETAPDWLVQSDGLWLAIPLRHEESLLGIVLLARPRVPQQLNWETLDIIKTASRQAASYLALERAAEALADARQFEGFNRLSAFVVHDLKNLIAQLSLVVKNAERHKGNPRFLEDAITTVSNSVERMNRLLAQLKSSVPGDRAGPLMIEEVMEEAVAECSSVTPRPRLELPARGRSVLFADRDRFVAVLGHVIQNAQDAVSKDGEVVVRLEVDGGMVRIDVVDDGVGMDGSFIRERLFKPFDSTKGLAGMGIGAYECREFIRALGGRVEVSSAPGRGTRFSMFLPSPQHPPASVDAPPGGG